MSTKDLISMAGYQDSSLSTGRHVDIPYLKNVFGLIPKADTEKYRLEFISGLFQRHYRAIVLSLIQDSWDRGLIGLNVPITVRSEREQALGYTTFH